MTWEFTTPTQVIFGSGSVNKLNEIISSENHILFLTGANGLLREKLESMIKVIGCKSDFIEIHKEPSVDNLRKLVSEFHKSDVDMVVAAGGGSVMDTGKALAAFLPHDLNILDHLEVVGKGNPIDRPGLRMIAVPTTAGTGSEVTRNSVLSIPESGIKVSLRGKALYPSVAIVDPELTLSLPPQVTGYTGMDALTQLIESFVSLKSTPITEGLCKLGLNGISNHLLAAYSNGQDIASREAMSFGSLMSGLALANSGLGAVHGFAAVIGGMYDIAHGQICAALLPAVCQINIEALYKQNPRHPTLHKYETCAQILAQNPDTGNRDLIPILHDLQVKLNIRQLSALGINSDAFPELITRAKASSSMKGNPILLSDTELLKILELAS